MTAISQCVEQINAYILDGNEPVSTRTLSTKCQASENDRVNALTQILKDNPDNIHGLEVTIEVGIEQNTSKSMPHKKAQDARARVIRLTRTSVNSHTLQDGEAKFRTLYAVYPTASSETPSNEGEIISRMSITLWDQERKARNEVFRSISRSMRDKENFPLPLQQLYSSSIICNEANSRSNMGQTQGEKAVSMFDLHGSSSSENKPNVKRTETKSMFSTNATIEAKNTKSKSNTKSSKINGASVSFPRFQNDAKQKAKDEQRKRQENTKKLDDSTMRKVLSVDSESSEESGSENDEQPVFVRKKPVSNSNSGISLSRNRIIDDDEEDDHEIMENSKEKPPAPKKTLKRPAATTSNVSKGRKSVKRKLNDSPQKKEELDTDSTSEPEADNEDIENKAPVDIIVPSTRHVKVTKTRVTDEGYMVTEESYEEVQLTAEEIAREKKAMEEKALKAASLKSKLVQGNGKNGQSAKSKQKDLRSFFCVK